MLDSVSCEIESGDRIGLVGRNGAGKTTLLRMLCRQVLPDHGKIEIAAGTRVALLPQDVPRDLTGTVEQVVFRGLPDDWQTHESPWEYERQVTHLLQEMELQPTDLVETLSAGRKRRVLLARTLASAPQVLLLDEPTNHLDLPSIEWLEEFLGQRWQGTLFFVTHDRFFLQRIASRILEIDRGRLFDWSCDYTTFLQRKSSALEAEAKQQALFDKKLAAEEVWIRQGIKARRTRNEGRVRALQALRAERIRRQDAPQQVRLKIQAGERSGNLVVEAKEIEFGYADRTLVSNFSTLILRGDKVGVVGPNGAGKTTLLRLLLGELAPSSGQIRLGTNLQIAYFDQLRGQLREEQTVQENVGDGYDTVRVGDTHQHVLGYLQNFLFSPERARTQVRFLSGGERNRVLLAKLFAKTANVIVLDEPTNDLDAETLELLEDQLVQFAGTVIVVSHDRAFLNEVTTSIIAFEPYGIKEYMGGYDDWQRQRESTGAGRIETRDPVTRPLPNVKPALSSGPKKKLTFNEKHELTRLPGRIEKLETAIAQAHLTMADAAFWQQPKSAIVAVQEQLAQNEQELRQAYARWEELEAIGE